jgi:hypothetical protein
VLAMTYATYTGNLGGTTGGNAKCAAEFGTGWKFATYGKLVGLQMNVNMTAWVDAGPTVSCNNWTDGTNAQTGAYTQINAPSGALYWSYNTNSCNNNRQLLCTSF